MKTFFNSLLAAALLAVLVSCGGKSDPNLNIVLVPNPVSMETGGCGVKLAAPGMVLEIRTVIDASQPGTETRLKKPRPFSAGVFPVSKPV